MRAIGIARSAMVALSTFVLVQGLGSVAAAQNVYKTIDDLGNVEYTDRPPFNSDRPIERVKGLDIDWTDDDLIQAKNIETAKQLNAEKTAQNIRKQRDAEAAGVAAAEKEERAANCELAKQRMTKYSEAHRMYRETPDGGREYLTDDELDTARAKAVRSVEEWCD